MLADLILPSRSIGSGKWIDKNRMHDKILIVAQMPVNTGAVKRVSESKNHVMT